MSLKVAKPLDLTFEHPLTNAAAKKRRKSRKNKGSSESRRQLELCKRLSEPKFINEPVNRPSTSSNSRRLSSQKPIAQQRSVSVPKGEQEKSAPKRMSAEKSETAVAKRRRSEDRGNKKKVSVSKGNKEINELRKSTSKKQPQETTNKNVAKPLEIQLASIKEASTKNVSQNNVANFITQKTNDPMTKSKQPTPPLQRANEANANNLITRSRSNPLLDEIVTQSERDKPIFSLFESRWYIAQPIRDELTKRGWIEYKPDRTKIPRRPTRIITSIQRQTMPITDHSLGALHHAIYKGNSEFHTTAPRPTSLTTTQNLSIMEYGQRSQDQKPRTKKKFRRDSCRDVTTTQVIDETNEKVSLVWLSGKPKVQLQYFYYVPEIGNKFQRTTFCSKLGLWHNLENGQNGASIADSPVKYPRMYNLGDPVNLQFFIDDFKVTAVISFLRWFGYKRNGHEIAAPPESSQIIQLVISAVRKGALYVSFLKKGDAKIKAKFNNYGDWNEFLTLYSKIIGNDRKFKMDGSILADYMFKKARQISQEISQLRPEMDHDGVCNVWIVKPYSASCGRGIFITNNIEYIQQLPDKRYIIQKYIERPYIIAKTKFDIRQWFLLTSLHPLEFWIYKESYLRFCSMPFDMRNLHESVHLSNNAVQRRFARDVGLPYQNMWDSTTFKNYLQARHQQGALWDDVIFPGMRDALIRTLLSSQGTFDKGQKQGWFELYGADFLLTANLKDGPWLIEINEGPALDPSTPVTSRMCNQMLRDIVKVVVDRPNNKEADTGNWILAYRQPVPKEENGNHPA